MRREIIVIQARSECHSSENRLINSTVPSGNIKDRHAIQFIPQLFRLDIYEALRRNSYNGPSA
jgi:hypothetical protein